MRSHKAYLHVVPSTIWVRKLSLIVSRILWIAYALLSCWAVPPVGIRVVKKLHEDQSCSYLSIEVLIHLFFPVRQPRADLYLPPLILTHKLSLVSSSIPWYSFMHPRCFLTWRAKPIPPGPSSTEPKSLHCNDLIMVDVPPCLHDPKTRSLPLHRLRK